MKKIFMIGAMAVLMLSLSGCLSTLYPLFTEKDIVFEPALIGKWAQTGDKESLVFQKAAAKDLDDLPSLQKLADKAYIISMINAAKEVENKYCAFLTTVGGNMYLDFFPIQTPRQQQYDNFYVQHYIPMHSFYRVRMLNDRSFELGMLKGDFLQELINTKRIRIQHEEIADGAFVITAPTSELRQYVLKYGNDPEAYESADTYKKI